MKSLHWNLDSQCHLIDTFIASPKQHFGIMLLKEVTRKSLRNYGAMDLTCVLKCWNATQCHFLKYRAILCAWITLAYWETQQFLKTHITSYH